MDTEKDTRMANTLYAGAFLWRDWRDSSGLSVRLRLCLKKALGCRIAAFQYSIYKIYSRRNQMELKAIMAIAMLLFIGGGIVFLRIRKRRK
jgi:hypothetical protein